MSVWKVGLVSVCPSEALMRARAELSLPPTRFRDPPIS